MKSSRIAKFIGLELFGNDIEIKNVKSMSGIENNSITYAKKLDQDFVKKVNELSEVMVIADKSYKDKLTCTCVLSDNPRLDFIKTIREFFSKNNVIKPIYESAVIEKGAKIGKNVSIGANCFISKDVEIGDETRIHHNVIILGAVRIGKRCVVKSGAVLGEEGFGFEYDDNKEPLHFPHIGEVIIGNNVFIGSNTTIERATMDATIVCDNVKIDDLVQIGHNSTIYDNTMIMAGTIICGGVLIGKNCWIAPNVSIKQKLKIGDNACVGLGSVVIRDVLSGATVAGVPAKELKK